MRLAAVLAPWLLLSATPPLTPAGLPTAPASGAATPPGRCPADMQLVVGEHSEQLQRLCTDVRQGKCWAFFPHLLLLEPRRSQIATCMDRYEWPNKKGAEPEVMMRFTDAEASCAAVGKRLCSEFEWELACEGPEHRPWPYGYKQQHNACNSDRRYRPYSFDKLHSSNKASRDRETRRLWQGAPSGSHPACVSPYGVYDLIGNVEEWVSTSRPQWPHRSSLKGGFWAKPWSHCRGTNEAHAPAFRFYEIGFRCCQDPGSGPSNGPSKQP